MQALVLALEGPVWATTAEQPWSKLTLGAVMALLSSDREQTLAEGSRGEESEHTLTLADFSELLRKLLRLDTAVASTYAGG